MDSQDTTDMENKIDEALTISFNAVDRIQLCSVMYRHGNQCRINKSDIPDISLHVSDRILKDSGWNLYKDDFYFKANPN